jgi:hypothetical protein
MLDGDAATTVARAKSKSFHRRVKSKKTKSGAMLPVLRLLSMLSMANDGEKITFSKHFQQFSK